jgi:hypothetical protein
MRRRRHRETHPAIWLGVILALYLTAISGKVMKRESKKLARPPHGLAAALPLLANDHIEDVEAFHRVSFTNPPTASDEAVFRDPLSIISTPGKRILTVAKRVTPLEVPFSAPRKSWLHLGKQERGQIDLGTSGKWTRVVLHGSGSARGNLETLTREHRRLRGLSDGMACHFVIGNGDGSKDGEVQTGARWLSGKTEAALDDPALREGTISVCLVGDFHQRPPTKAQLEALDELVDYLTMKNGPLRVMTHGQIAGRESSACLGAHFPAEQITAAFGGAAL